ncbi:hypothetical protein AB6A40_011673 [Gnathostoma spinigerum]|uniref:Uncharacterized protein n=1 Tax=Gnathostoma spinigerum TaxID=75299 RepID=A0ABD6F3T4_9BILA
MPVEFFRSEYSSGENFPMTKKRLATESSTSKMFLVENRECYGDLSTNCRISYNDCGRTLNRFASAPHYFRSHI